jgi:hypothetical protein
MQYRFSCGEIVERSVQQQRFFLFSLSKVAIKQ